MSCSWKWKQRQFYLNCAFNCGCYSHSHTDIWLVLGILNLRVLIKSPHLFNAWWASALLTGIPVCVNQKQIWPSLPPSVENSHPLSEDGDLLGRRNKTNVGIQVETSETLKGHLWGTTALLPCLLILGSAIHLSWIWCTIYASCWKVVKDSVEK